MHSFPEPALRLVADLTTKAKANPARAVAFQGAPGCNGHRAALEYAPGCLPLPCFSFEDAIEAVREGRADRAIIPIENSQHGRVADIHFLLPESGLFIIGVFMLLFRWGWNIARRAPDRFSRLLAAGMVMTIFFYMAINLLMVMGLAPVVGIPLPFVSHGGSSMLTNMLCIGTLMAVDRWRVGSGALN